MTITIELTPAQEARLTAEAEREGLDPAKIVERLVVEHLPRVPGAGELDPMLALFAQWDEEDENMTPDEISEENRTWVKFTARINSVRDGAGARRVF